MAHLLKNKYRNLIYFFGGAVVLFAITGVAWRFFSHDVVIDVSLSVEERTDLLSQREKVLNAIQDSPQNPDNYLELGIIEKSLGNLSAAARAYMDGIKQHDDFYLNYLNLGSIYEDMGRFDDALSMYQKGIVQKPIEEMGYEKLISLYKSHFPDRLLDLDAVFLRAIDLTGSVDIMKSYARFLESRGQIRDAWIYWQEVLDRTGEPDLAQKEVDRLGNILEGE